MGFHVLATELAQFVPRQHPVSVTGTVNDDDLLDRHTVAAYLRDLHVVLGKEESAAGVAQDEGDILGARAGVDGGVRTRSAHDGQVGEDPLDAGAAGDADAVFFAQAQRDESGRELGDLVTGLLPGPRLPAAALNWSAKGFGGPGGRNPVEEESAEAGRHGRMGRGQRTTGAGHGFLLGRVVSHRNAHPLYVRCRAVSSDVQRIAGVCAHHGQESTSPAA